MAKDDYDGEVAIGGTWLYDGRIPMRVEIVAFDCDFHFERLPCDDGRADWSRPYPLNANGCLYYLRFGGDVLALPPFIDVGDAKAWIEIQPWAPVTWDQ